MLTDRADKIRKTMKGRPLSEAHKASLRVAHNRPETKKRHRQATIRQLAAIEGRSPIHTPIEIRLAEGMKEAGLSFATQQRLLDKYVVDFLMIGKPLVIEADGFTHRLPKSQERDRIRDSELNASGYFVLRFPGSQIMRYPSECVLSIKEKMQDLKGQIPESQIVVIGNQEGPNNPAYGKPSWNKGLKAATDERQRRMSERAIEGRNKTNFNEIMVARWAAYRSKFDWEGMKSDYAEMRSVNKVAAKHGVGKRQCREYLKGQGIILDGQEFIWTKHRIRKSSIKIESELHGDMQS